MLNAGLCNILWQCYVRFTKLCLKMKNNSFSKMKDLSQLTEHVSQKKKKKSEKLMQFFIV